MLRRMVSTVAPKHISWKQQHHQQRRVVGGMTKPFAASLTTRRNTTTTPTTTSSPFRPWGVHRIEATGDYRDDAWLETHIGGPLYEHQTSLPRLPVPGIDETLQRFVPTALPLAESDAERNALLDAVQRFPSQAASLQERLEQRRADASTNSSWLQHWWNTLGYLQVRDPVVINVSYYFDFNNDNTSTNNVQRGAALLTAVADFRKQVCSGNHPAEQLGRGDKRKPICSTAYKYLFHACRIPQFEQDTYRAYDPALHHHAVVARKGHFFAVEFLHPGTGEPYPLTVLESALQQCIDQADAMELSLVPKLGWLTSQDRDAWAKGRAVLLERGGPAMEAALEKLESGAVLICLDDEAPVSVTESSRLLLYGGDSASSGANRWFDKSMQLIVSNNGRAGLLGEHSMMDGMPVVQFADLLTIETYGKCQERQASLSPPDSGVARVEPIFGADLSPALHDASDLVNDAKAALEAFVDNHSLHVQRFHGYGSTWVKKSAGMSPDAFVQMAMQVATSRLFGKQVGTYEATQVRPFLHGRTETTRSVSTESAAMVEAFGMRPYSKLKTPAEKVDLLRNAAGAHAKYIGNAAKALGVDRHFLGLSLLSQEGESLPDLYQDPVFVRSKRWRASTSNLSHPNFANWGYGEVVPDGVGLSYSIHPKHFVFSVTARAEHQWTEKLVHLLEEALLEMRDYVELTNLESAASEPKSRL